ncbi:Holliday junction branch migration protein RuvA [bacterium]|nr:Holliday junction branch migration protein RuvA [bacterium]
MIAQLTGILKNITEDGCLVDVNGVGYEVFVSKNSVPLLTQKTGPVTLYIYTHMNEGSISLFGFISGSDKTLFKKLISVSGIGPKMGLQLLSGMSTSDLIMAITTENVAKLTTISGIGKKTAERLIVELKDKLMSLADDKTALSLVTNATSRGGAYDEVVSALMNLGYNRQTAERVMGQVPVTAESRVEDLLKKSLTVLAQNAGL